MEEGSKLVSVGEVWELVKTVGDGLKWRVYCGLTVMHELPPEDTDDYTRDTVRVTVLLNAEGVADLCIKLREYNWHRTKACMVRLERVADTLYIG